MESLLGDDLIFVWNILIAFLTLIYIFGIIATMEKLVDTKKISSDLSRKVIHVAAGSWIIFWFLFDVRDITWVLNIAVPGLFALTFLVKGLTATPEDKDVKTMTRTGNPKELLLGPFFFTLSMITLGTIFYGSYAAVISMAFLGWGDGLAPYFGKYYGKRTYKTLGREKTLEGTAVVFIAGALAAVVFSLLLSSVLTPYDAASDFVLLLIAIGFVSVLATVVEALSPADVDNLLLPAACIIGLVIVDMLLQTSFVTLAF